MFVKKIKIGTEFQKDLALLVHEAEKCSEDIKAMSGPYVVNAKSFLGVLSLDLSKPIEVGIETNNRDVADKFFNGIKKLILK